MSKTHPVNALKKLGIGLAFGAATIMSMPTSALACTQMYMGNKLTYAPGREKAQCQSA